MHRIINVPKRGIGAVTINKVQEYANALGISFFQALEEVDKIPGIGKAFLKIQPFVNLIHEWRMHLADLTLEELINDVLERTGYAKELKDEGTDEAQARLDNIGELINKAVLYEKEAEIPDLSGFLEEVALVADIDGVEDSDDRVLLMTLHSAKGLEFPYVFLTGMEEGVFPSYMSIAADDPVEEIEEERRLCYVGITRAMEELTITAVRVRMVRGENHYNQISRFVREIPKELLGQEVTETFKKNVQELPQNQTYARAREAFRTKTFDPQQFKVVKAERLDYGVGDRVSHVKFGEGTVLGITDGGKDYEVKVEFDRAGVKKMFASFAKLKKIESL